MRADTDGSAPVSFAAANARGDVMQRVRGANDIYNRISYCFSTKRNNTFCRAKCFHTSAELNIAMLARSAELSTPNTAADSVEESTAGRLRNNIPRY